MTQAPGALIVGGAHVSLGVARSLGRHGVPVWLLNNHPIATFSRYVQRSVPWPGADHADGLASIMDIGARHHLDGVVLLATGDQDMRLIAQNRALLATKFCVPTQDWDTMRWIFDKRLTYQRAAELGIDCPWSFHPQGLDDIARLDCRFPVILKPAVREGADEFTQAKAWKAENREALLSLYKRAAMLVGDDAVIVQEWVPGAGAAQFSYTGLWERGEPVVSLTARRTRQHPVDFGRSSTFVETIEQDEVEALARRFLKSLDYTGIAEVEFKHDARDGHFKLLDVNGRFWTWNSLGAFAGADFPYLAWRQALGLPVTPCRARAGAAWMHASRDVIAAVQEIAGGNLSLRDYARCFTKPMTFASFALDDPLPAIVEFPVAAWNRIANRWRGRPQKPTRKTLTGRLAG